MACIVLCTYAVHAKQIRALLFPLQLWSGSGMQGAPTEGNLERVAGNHSHGILGFMICKV